MAGNPSWVKGKSGNPGGRSTEKVFADALRAVSNEIDPKTKRKNLFLIAEKLVECALNGEGWAIQQFADRLDGKPAQESTVTFEKRDESDWSRAELVAILNDAVKGRADVAEVGRRGEQFN